LSSIFFIGSIEKDDSRFGSGKAEEGNSETLGDYSPVGREVCARYVVETTEANSKRGNKTGNQRVRI
jgi:hypothetical protein